MSDPFRSDAAVVGGLLMDGRRCPDCDRLLPQTLVSEEPPSCPCGWTDASRSRSSEALSSHKETERSATPTSPVPAA